MKAMQDANNKRAATAFYEFLNIPNRTKTVAARNGPRFTRRNKPAADIMTTVKTLDANVWNVAMGAGNAEINKLLAGLNYQEIPQQFLKLKLNGKTVTFNVQFRDINNASDNSTNLIAYAPDKNGNIIVGFQISINAAGAKTADAKAMESAKGMHLFHEMHHLVIQAMDIAAANGVTGIPSPIYNDYKKELALSKQAKAESGQLASALGTMIRLKDGTLGNAAINKRVNELVEFLVNERFVASRTQAAFNEPGSNNLIAGKYAQNIIKNRLHTDSVLAAGPINRNLPGLIAGFYNAYSK
jgi:hypothetical protein